MDLTSKILLGLIAVGVWFQLYFLIKIHDYVSPTALSVNHIEELVGKIWVEMPNEKK